MIRDVHLLVLDTLADWEPGFAVAHINRPAPGVPRRTACASTVGASRAPIKTLGGVTILPDIVLDELRPEASAMLILPGAEIWSDARTDGALTKAREFVEAGVPVAAICGATFGLRAWACSTSGDTRVTIRGSSPRAGIAGRRALRERAGRRRPERHHRIGDGAARVRARPLEAARGLLRSAGPRSLVRPVKTRGSRVLLRLRRGARS